MKNARNLELAANNVYLRAANYLEASDKNEHTQFIFDQIGWWHTKVFTHEMKCQNYVGAIETIDHMKILLTRLENLIALLELNFDDDDLNEERDERRAFDQEHLVEMEKGDW